MVTLYRSGKLIISKHYRLNFLVIDKYVQTTSYKNTIYLQTTRNRRVPRTNRYLSATIIYILCTKLFYRAFTSRSVWQMLQASARGRFTKVHLIHGH